MIRPRAARWFEIVVAGDDAFAALEALAAAGCVQIEWHGAEAEPPGWRAVVTEIAELGRRFRSYWPAPATRLAASRMPPLQSLREARDLLRRWATQAEAPIAGLQQAQAQLGALQLARSALAAFAGSGLDFAQLAQAQQGVRAALYLLPPAAAASLARVPDEVLLRRAGTPQGELLLAVGSEPALAALAHTVAQANGRHARLPDWLQSSAAQNDALLAQHEAQAQQALARQQERLRELEAEFDLPHALAAISRAHWCVEHGGAIGTGPVLARITGWTIDAGRVVAAVQGSEARALVDFPPAPRGARPPLILSNPWWARPFELFPRLVGMPDASSTDPSVLLAFMVPLLFGYMFGDVGQGFVLLLIGLLLRDRLPVLRLLVPAGFAAMLFGLLFGSVFSLETLLHPLWLLPLEQPLPVLLVPIVGGALLLLLGLLLNVLEAWWQRRLDEWMRDEAPLLLLYLGVLLGFVQPAAFWLVPLAFVWAGAGALLATVSAKSLLAGLVGLIEHGLQILINTLSFARVGAFALAHAGLSSAVVALAHSTGSRWGFALVLLLGNVLILAIEGLVVSVQTTRLVLFEFFARFFHGEGRAFRPLAPPPVTP